MRSDGEVGRERVTEEERWRREMEEGDGGGRWKREMEEGDGRGRWRREIEEGDGGEAGVGDKVP